MAHASDSEKERIFLGQEYQTHKSVNVQLGEKIQSISNRVDIEFNNCYTDVIKDERIKRKAEVCQVSPRPHSGPMIHQNNSQNSGKLLFLWLCFITVEYRLNFAKEKDELKSMRSQIHVPCVLS